MSQRSAADGDSLILLAHGSADVRHRRGLEVLMTAVARRVDLHVRVAYLDHHGPDAEQVASQLVATGHLHAWVLPVFTSRGYHLRVDVPSAMARMTDFGLQVDEVEPGLAGNPALVRAALSAATGPASVDPVTLGPAPVDPVMLDPGSQEPGSQPGSQEPGSVDAVPTPDRPVVLFAAGSTDRAACTELARQAVGAARGPVAAAFLTGGPGLMPALASLPASSQEPVILPFVVAAGILRDRMAQEAASAGLQLVAGGLSDNPAVADMVAKLVNTGATVPV